MNTKRKSILGITLAFVMIASVFAVIAPSTIAEEDGVTPLAGFSANIDAKPAGLSYWPGMEISYAIRLRNSGTYDATVDIWVEYPNGDTHDCAVDQTYGANGDEFWCNVTTTVGDDWANFDVDENFITTVRVVGTDASVPPDTINVLVTTTTPIAQPPELDFTFDAIGCQEMSFSGSADQEMANHTWMWGDGSNSGAIAGNPGDITHEYDVCGLKRVTLKGYSTVGIYAEVEKDVFVACGPDAKAFVDPQCFDIGGTEITFDGSASTAGDVPIASYLWEFSDGGSDNQAITTRTVDAPLTATLTVTDELGCEDSTALSVGPCAQCSLRLYGTFGEGAGDEAAVDPETELPPENMPYSDPIGPFYPQHEQAPRKDFITFNPAIMDHNQGWSELSFQYCGDGDVQQEKEKVFKRMWYEKEWFKDHDGDGIWDTVGDSVWNNDPTKGDIYGPAINQEFTYMFLNEETMPIMVNRGSRVLIPMAHDDANPYRGLNSFDADGNGARDYVMVESEQSLSQLWETDVDIDHDGVVENMGDGTELSGDESVVLVLDEKTLHVGDEIQFFDHKVKVKEIFGPSEKSATILVRDNEGGERSSEISMSEGDIEYFYRAQQDYAPGQTFFVRVIALNWPDDNGAVRLQVGRMFGQTYANIGANQFWSQKAFIVDGVFYNVVAIKAVDNCIKYITFRQKLPKMPIKLYGVHLAVWPPYTTLPEMPPFNMNHEVMRDVLPDWPSSPPTDKIGDKIPRPPLDIDYILEDEEERYYGELKEIYSEHRMQPNGDEHWEGWLIEWFLTYPLQFTEFRLPPDEEYLVTLSWTAEEAHGYLWDHTPGVAMEELEGGRFKFWYRDCTGPLYIDDDALRLYGTFGEGPGNDDVLDPETDRAPENKPYTDPEGPFFPQHDQAPEKDFVTFNPAIMDHNQGWPELSFKSCDGLDVQREKEKVFKRMWYEKEWFKDHDGDGIWDKVGSNVWNNDPTKGDIYGPAINQEFTYMFLDDETMPLMIERGSRVLIPMAHDNDDNAYRGLNSFDADGDSVRDYVIVESEQSLSQLWETDVDIDHDGVVENMGDGFELSGDETVVLMLPEKTLHVGDELQFFDHKVKLAEIFGPDSRSATLLVRDNEGGDRSSEVSMSAGDIEYFYRAQQDYAPGQTFFVRVIAINWLPDGSGAVRLQVGRMFGQTYANIGANTFWNQKAFIVDNVFYNVVAIKAVDNCIKYITFRQKLPKMPIKLYGVHLEVWAPGEILPEMSPFNMYHEIMVDVLKTHTYNKIGVKQARGPLVIKYKEETEETRFKGRLKEIYWELSENEGPEEEFWTEEWFWTYPWQYTSFVLPDDQLYLVTLAWKAPEGMAVIWDGDGSSEPVAVMENTRVKFWYDPADKTDLYVNRLGAGTPTPTTVTSYYDDDGDGKIDLEELVSAIWNYLDDGYPFGPDGQFDKPDLVQYLQTYVNQESTL